MQYLLFVCQISIGKNHLGHLLRAPPHIYYLCIVSVLCILCKFEYCLRTLKSTEHFVETTDSPDSGISQIGFKKMWGIHREGVLTNRVTNSLFFKAKSL